MNSHPPTAAHSVSSQVQPAMWRRGRHFLAIAMIVATAISATLVLGCSQMPLATEDLLMTKASYRLFSHPKHRSELGCWEQQLDADDFVVGYSALGTVFLVNEHTKEYLLLDPLLEVAEGNARASGRFESLKDFEQSVLQDKSIAEPWLQPRKVHELARLHGPLEDLEVYIPTPMPVMGGTGALDNYVKGNLWVFADIAGQMSGACR